MRNGLKTSALAVMAAATVAWAAVAAGPPGQTFAWAFAPFPPPPPGKAKAPPRQGLSVPGSTRRYDEDKVTLFEAVDWFPDRHPAAPALVLQGRKPDAMACGYCHLPDGQGRPENAALAGLPAAYIAEQVRDLRSGARTGAEPDWLPTRFMGRVAKAVSDPEVAQIARYFSGIRYEKVFRLVETRDIPAVTPIGGLYGPKPGGGRERLGARIIEVPNDVDRFELRDNRPGYTVYVPEGAIARGRALAEDGGNGRFPACATCHGAGLRGGLGPPIAGRYPAYLFRQLLGFSTGGRTGPDAAAMAPVARQLKPDEMIALAAYAASLKP
jgi:cytochrome c553